MCSVCLQGMAQLTKLIFQRAQPKRLGSQVITGPMLATLASEYVRAINEGAVPTISTAWQVRLIMASNTWSVAPVSPTATTSTI